MKQYEAYIVLFFLSTYLFIITFAIETLECVKI